MVVVVLFAENDFVARGAGAMGAISGTRGQLGRLFVGGGHSGGGGFLGRKGRNGGGRGAR